MEFTEGEREAKTIHTQKMKGWAPLDEGRAGKQSPANFQLFPCFLADAFVIQKRSTLQRMLLVKNRPIKNSHTNG